MKNIITDLDTIKQLAAQQHDDFEVMRYMLQADDDINDSALDALVDAVAAPVIDTVDCTQCANCCRNLDVYLTPDDVSRLAAIVDTSLSHFIDYTKEKYPEECGLFRQKPCHFLEGKRCSIYPDRPESCRIYPAFTPDFRWALEDTIAGASHCPIIYNVLVRMLDKTDSIIAGEL